MSSPEFDGNSTEDYNSDSDLDSTIVYDLEVPTTPTTPPAPAVNTDIASDVPLPPSADPQEEEEARTVLSPEEPMDMTQPIQEPPSPPPCKCYIGHPKGKAKPHTSDFSAPGSILQKNVRHDRVDEECIRLNIAYKKWKPLNPNQKSHVTIRDFNNATKVPDEQEIPEWCIICPQNSLLNNAKVTRNHYLSWHHKKMLVIGNQKLWACKCSEMWSRGNDNSARNMHYHCTKCFQSVKLPSQLTHHMVTQHTTVEVCQVHHLMDDKTKEKHPY